MTKKQFPNIAADRVYNLLRDTKLAGKFVPGGQQVEAQKISLLKAVNAAEVDTLPERAELLCMAIGGLLAAASTTVAKLTPGRAQITDDDIADAIMNRAAYWAREYIILDGKASKMKQ